MTRFYRPKLPTVTSLPPPGDGTKTWNPSE